MIKLNKEEDARLEELAQKHGMRWDGDRWVIEDASFHPFMRAMLAAPQAEPVAYGKTPGCKQCNEAEACGLTFCPECDAQFCEAHDGDKEVAAAPQAEPVAWKLFKQALFVGMERDCLHYLMANAHGRRDGALKAHNHELLCRHIVAAVRGCGPDQARWSYEDEYQAVHDGTQALTSYLDEVIGFPLDSRPDYEDLTPKFFDKFFELAMQALGMLAQSPNIGTMPVKGAYFLCKCENCGWMGSSEEAVDGGDDSYYCPNCGDESPDEFGNTEQVFNIMLKAMQAIDVSPATQPPAAQKGGA